MLTGLIILHVVVCILLTIVVLVQFGKGAEAGAMMGQGSSQAVFTSSAKGNFFTKMTTVLAITFMITSIILTTMKSQESKESIFDGEAPVAAPLNNDALKKSEITAPTKESTTTETATETATKQAPETK